jgi:protein-disulfide isomerase
MKLAVLALMIGCAGNLEKRVGDLESRPSGDPTAQGKIEVLEKRLAESEKAQRRQADEIKELQKIVHELADQLADVIADQPMGGTPPPAPPPLPPPTGRVGLDPSKIYAIALDDSPVINGNANSPVTLVAALQFPEPFSHRSWPVLQQLVADYGVDLRLVIKMYVVHQQAMDSTIAGCAVAMQKKLDDYERLVNDAHVGGHWPDAAESRSLALTAGANSKKFDGDVARTCTPGKARDIKNLGAIGQAAVPVFYINGRVVSGAQPIASFKTIIDDEIAKAATDRAKGGKAATYYQRAVLNVGIKP